MQNKKPAMTTSSPITNKPAAQYSSGDLAQRIKRSKEFGGGAPALDKMPPEILIQIFKFIVANVSCITFEPWIWNRTGEEIRTRNKKRLRETLVDAMGLLYACRRLRREFLAYLVRDKLFHFSLDQYSSRALPKALSFLDMHQLKLLQIELGMRHEGLEPGAADFVGSVVRELPNLRFLSLKMRPAAWPESMTPVGTGLSYCPIDVAHPTRITSVLRVAAFLVHRHPYLRRLTYIHEKSSDPCSAAKEVELANDHHTATAANLCTVKHKDMVMSAVLNATAIRRLIWNELLDTRITHLVVPEEFNMSKIPDRPEDQGHFHRVDEEGLLTDQGRAAKGINRRMEVDELIEEARAAREQAMRMMESLSTGE